MEPELIPSPCWGADLSSCHSGSGSRSERPSLSALPVVVRYAGPVKRLICHERWEYADTAGIAHLRELIALCFKCSEVIHLGNSQAMANAGKINMAGIWRQFMRVNGISREAAQDYLEHAFALWRSAPNRAGRSITASTRLWSRRGRG